MEMEMERKEESEGEKEMRLENAGARQCFMYLPQEKGKERF